MTYVTSQSLQYLNDTVVLNTSGATAITAVLTGTNAGSTVLVEGSNDAVNWSTISTLSAAGSYPITFGTYPLVRLRLSVIGSGSYVAALQATLAPQGFTTLTSTADVALTPTVTAGAYTAGNVVGGKLIFTNVFGSSLTGYLTDILVKAKTVQTTTYKLYLFSQNPTNTTWTDKTAPAINALDLPYLLGVFTTGASDSGLGTETTNQLDNLTTAIHSVDQNLYGILVCVATPTFGSTSDVTVSVRVKQN